MKKVCVVGAGIAGAHQPGGGAPMLGFPSTR